MSHMIQNSKLKNLEDNIFIEQVEYSEEDHKTWRDLYTTQIQNLKELAYTRVLECLEEFSLPENRIPQLEEITQKLYQKAGWKVTKVDGLIEGDIFFQLLANKIFPSTVYIRNKTEIDLSRDPDIFHEIFGHCSLLLDKDYAELFKRFGYIGLQLDDVQRAFFQRLFWFTIETGLIDTSNGLKIYGGSLVSSIKESRYAIENNKVIRRPLNMIDVLRTPYRADILQPIYYIIRNFSELQVFLSDINLIKKNIEMAYEFGEIPPLFLVENEYSKYTSYNICKKAAPELIFSNKDRK